MHSLVLYNFINARIAVDVIQSTYARIANPRQHSLTKVTKDMPELKSKTKSHLGEHKKIRKENLKNKFIQVIQIRFPKFRRWRCFSISLS